MNRRQNPPDDPGPPIEDGGAARRPTGGDGAGAAAAPSSDPGRRRRRLGRLTGPRPASRSPVRIALLGLGLIGGSIARALRLGRGRRTGTSSRGARPGRGPASALADGRDRCRGARPAATRSSAPISSCSRRRPRTASRCSTASPARWPGRSRAGAIVTDVASTKGAIVERAARTRPALRRRPSDGRSRGDRVRGGHRGPVRRAAVDPRPGRHRLGEAEIGGRRVARPGVRGPAGGHDRRGRTMRRSPASATCRSSLAWPWSRPSPGGVGEPARPTGPRPPDLAAGGLARHDPARARRPADGRGDRDDERRGPRRPPPRPPRRHRRLARPRSSGPAARTRPTLVDRLAVGARPAGATDRWMSSSSSSRATSSPRRRAGTACARTCSRASRPSWRRHGRFEPRAAMEVDPSAQAGHPVPRAARRRALLPDAPDAGRAPTPGCTTATRSASAGT